MRVETPQDCSGPFSTCVLKNPSLTLAKFYRGQMRGWAGRWRERKYLSAVLRKPESEIAGVYLSLAKSYRDSAHKEDRAAR